MARHHRKKQTVNRALLHQKEDPEVKRREPRRDRLIAMGLLTFLCLLAFANSFSNGFAFDDEAAIVGNPLIKRLADLPTLFTTHYWAGVRSLQQGQDVSGDLYRPLVLATFALNYAVGGLNPFGYHLVNLVLHIAVCILLYEMARQFDLSQGTAIAASALFAVHPIHTEAVTGIVGRAELLMALGVLSALHWYRQGVGPLRLPLRSALASWGSFLAALLSKEQAMVLPALLVLSDLSERKGPRIWKAWFQSVWPWYLGYGLLLGAYLALRTAVLGRFFSTPNAIPFLDNPLAQADWFTRVCTVAKVAGKYLWLFVWPAHLSADYSYHAIPVATSLREPGVLAGFAAWGGLLGLAAYSALRSDCRIFFAIGLTALTFLLHRSR